MALTPVSRGALLKDTRASAQVQNKLQGSHDPADFVREIAAEWGNVRQSFLRIGQYLVTAKLNLQHGEYIKMINAELPFGRNVAHQLATVYLAVENNDMPRDVLPASYTTCYRIARLDPDLRHRAIAEGIVHPRATLRDISAFVDSAKSGAGDAIDALERERTSLESELASLRAREKTILRRLEDIAGLMAEVSG
jgi:hypothetical protein